MDILSINKFFWRKGGSESVFFGEKELLEKAGHTVIPFSMCSGNNFESEYSKYFVAEANYENPTPREKAVGALNILYSFEARKKMAALLSNHTADLAHFHIFQHQISPSVFNPIRKRNIPIILTLHDLMPLLPIFILSFSLPHISRIFSCRSNASPVRKIDPSIPSSINSGIPPISAPMTGVPRANDSKMLIGQFSYQREGTTEKDPLDTQDLNASPA